MKQTTNLKLNKPDYEDIADVAKLNENSDILDREVNDRLSTTKGGTVEKDLTVNGKLNANGETKVSGTMQTADVFVGGWNTSTRMPTEELSSLRVNGTLETYGEIHTNGGTIDCGNIKSKAIEAQGDIRTSTNAQISGGLTVNGTTTLNNQMRLNGTLDMTGQSLKAGDGTFTGTLRAKSDLITHNVKPETDNTNTLGNSSKYYKKAYINGIAAKNGLTVDSDVTINGALKANNLSADTFLSETSVNPVQNKIIKAALDKKSDIGHKHTMDDIVFFVDADLECLYTYTVHAEMTAPDEGNHVVGWQVVNYSEFPASTLRLAIEKLDTFEFGGNTYTTKSPTVMGYGVMVTELPSPSVPSWSAEYDTLRFYTFNGYVRYIASGEYPENNLIYRVGDSETFSLEFESKGNFNVTPDSELSSSSTNAVQNKVIKAALDKKADKVHTHSLTDNTITGTLPISKGGTGGTTVTDARSKLGLGSAATYNAGGSITTGNNSLVTGGTVAAFFNAQKIQKRTHIVIAAYDTKNPLKANADYTCTSSNASSIIKNALSAISEGGRIELLDGTYQLNYSESEITIDKKSVTIEGSGFTTVVKQPIDEGAGEAKPVFVINAQNVTIKNMMICDAVVSSPDSMIIQKTQGAIYESVFFIYGASESSCDNACIEGQNDCNFTRIQNCRVYKSFQNTDKYMFDFSKCTSFSGIIGANISSGYGDISIKFKDINHKNNTVIYGHKSTLTNI